MNEVEPDRHFEETIDSKDIDFPAYSFIQLARMYDLLAIIARALDPAGAKEVLDGHEKGILTGAPPSLNMGE